MSTSLLYHGFGIIGYKYVSSNYDHGNITFKITQEDRKLKCSVCESSDVIRKGSTMRKFRSLPIGSKTVWISFAVPRVKCKQCGLVRQVKIGFADFRKSYTRIFERYAIELSKKMTIQDVARYLKISWDVIKDIQKRYLTKHYDRPVLKRLKKIAIDEISIKKNHKYLTVVQDLESSEVVFVGDGKGAEALLPFWKKIRHSGAKIKAVAIDMSPAYISAVQTNLKKAKIVFDHFHVIKLFNDRLSKFRRQLYQFLSKSEKKIMKGIRWLLLKNPENLNPEKNEENRLKKALKLNQPLASAYYLKENLRQIWKQLSKKAAEDCLNDWVEQARSSGIKMLGKFADTLLAHRTGILSFYDHPISTGPLEGLNNKIKTMKRQAYGYRDIDFFKLKIKALHESRYALVG